MWRPDYSKDSANCILCNKVQLSHCKNTVIKLRWFIREFSSHFLFKRTHTHNADRYSFAFPKTHIYRGKVFWPDVIKCEKSINMCLRLKFLYKWEVSEGQMCALAGVRAALALSEPGPRSAECSPAPGTPVEREGSLSLGQGDDLWAQRCCWKQIKGRESTHSRSFNPFPGCTLPGGSRWEFTSWQQVHARQHLITPWHPLLAGAKFTNLGF